MRKLFWQLDYTVVNLPSSSYRQVVTRKQTDIILWLINVFWSLWSCNDKPQDERCLFPCDNLPAKSRMSMIELWTDLSSLLLISPLETSVCTSADASSVSISSMWARRVAISIAGDSPSRIPGSPERKYLTWSRRSRNRISISSSSGPSRGRSGHKTTLYLVPRLPNLEREHGISRVPGPCGLRLLQLVPSVEICRFKLQFVASVAIRRLSWNSSPQN